MAETPTQHQLQKQQDSGAMFSQQQQGLDCYNV